MVFVREIHNQLSIQNPYTITQAICLAKLIEAKIKYFKPRSSNPYSSNSITASTANSFLLDSRQAQIPQQTPKLSPITQNIQSTDP